MSKHVTTLERLNHHGYIVASSGSGKSELIKSLVFSEAVSRKKKGAIIVIDPH